MLVRPGVSFNQVWRITVIAENSKGKRPKAASKKPSSDDFAQDGVQGDAVAEVQVEASVAIAEPTDGMADQGNEQSAPLQAQGQSSRSRSKRKNRNKRRHEERQNEVNGNQAPLERDEDEEEYYARKPSPDEPAELRVSLSKSLFRKIKEQAADEGISLEEFATELLSEGVVLRAWEIVERKNQMRGGNSQQPNGNNRGGQPGNNRGGQNNYNNHNKKGRMSHMRYQSIMDDKATFLEYVRNQERNRR